MTEAPADPEILAPPGLPILEAARWIGNACWTELRLHEVLTAWLTIEPDPLLTMLLWSERADAAERAEQWHRRLPELREYPRSSFVEASSGDVARLFNGLTALMDPNGSELRHGALAAVLRGLRVGYHERQAITTGTADGPTARTLRAALRSTFGVGGTEPDPGWTLAVAEAGGLP